MNTLVSLRIKTTQNYQKNLSNLTKQIKKNKNDSIILASEVFLTGFDYENFESAASFSKEATQKLLDVLDGRVLIITMIVKKSNAFYNEARVLYDNKIVYTQSKNKLFTIGDETKFFTSHPNKPLIFELNGVKFGILICFELRFKEYYNLLEGCDIIFVPAMWGKIRSANFETLTRSLAVLNQCYVVASDSSNADCSGRSNITTPFGEQSFNRNKLCLKIEYNKKLINKMRRYLNIGIK